MRTQAGRQAGITPLVSDIGVARKNRISIVRTMTMTTTTTTTTTTSGGGDC